MNNKKSSELRELSKENLLKEFLIIFNKEIKINKDEYIKTKGRKNKDIFV